METMDQSFDSISSNKKDSQIPTIEEKRIFSNQTKTLTINHTKYTYSMHHISPFLLVVPGFCSKVQRKLHLFKFK